VVAARHARLRTEGVVQAQAQREARLATAVGLGVDDRRDRVDRRIGVAQPGAKERLPRALGAAHAGGIERGRRVVDGHHLRPERVSGLGHAQRRPERVVQEDHVGAQALERALQGSGAQRDAVAVGGDQPQAGQLVAPVVVALARAGDDDVVLEGAGGARVADLRVEVGADAARTLAVEEGDVDNAQMTTILVDPQPRTLDTMLDASTRARLDALGDVVVHEGAGRMPDAVLEAHLADTVAIVGQTDLDAERIARAPALRAVINVEGNFLRNVDYEACFARGIHVLVASPAFAPAVAEAALGMAIDLARGITAADRAMRAGTEAYGMEANHGAFLLAGSDVGVVGLGDLGRELVRLLAPFRCRVRAHDPWLPDLAIIAVGAEPSGLDDLLRASRVVFVFAAPTTDNQAMLGQRELELLPDGAAVLVMSRAAVVDLDALVALAAAGRLRAAVDVWPREPVPADHPARSVEGLLLSPHRTGGMPEAFQAIGRLVVADLELVQRGLPPVACRRAERETVARLRGRPIDEPE
jgi:phosphoglycerate dehydrogenase-like enzyme